MPGEIKADLSPKESFVTFHESSFREKDAQVRMQDSGVTENPLFIQELSCRLWVDSTHDQT